MKKFALTLLTAPAWQANPECRPRSAFRCCPLTVQALCPDTNRLIHDVLGPLFDNGIAGLMKLRYFAYGKARQGRDGLEVRLYGAWAGLGGWPADGRVCSTAVAWPAVSLAKSTGIRGTDTCLSTPPDRSVSTARSSAALTAISTALRWAELPPLPGCLPIPYWCHPLHASLPHLHTRTRMRPSRRGCTSATKRLVWLRVVCARRGQWAHSQGSSQEVPSAAGLGCGAAGQLRRRWGRPPGEQRCARSRSPSGRHTSGHRCVWACLRQGLAQPASGQLRGAQTCINGLVRQTCPMPSNAIMQDSWGTDWKRWPAAPAPLCSSAGYHTCAARLRL